MRAEAPDAKVALAFPRFPTFENLARQVSPPLQAAAIEIWLVDENGNVTNGP